MEEENDGFSWEDVAEQLRASMPHAWYAYRRAPGRDSHDKIMSLVEEVSPGLASEVYDDPIGAYTALQIADQGGVNWSMVFPRAVSAPGTRTPFATPGGSSPTAAPRISPTSRMEKLTSRRGTPPGCDVDVYGPTCGLPARTATTTTATATSTTRRRPRSPTSALAELPASRRRRMGLESSEELGLALQALEHCQAGDPSNSIVREAFVQLFPQEDPDDFSPKNMCALISERYEELEQSMYQPPLPFAPAQSKEKEEEERKEAGSLLPPHAHGYATARRLGSYHTSRHYPSEVRIEEVESPPSGVVSPPRRTTPPATSSPRRLMPSATSPPRRLMPPNASAPLIPGDIANLEALGLY